MGGISGDSGTLLNTGMSLMTRFNKRSTEADAAYAGAQATYERDVKNLTLQKLAFQQEADKANKQQVLSNLLLSQQQASILEDESRALGDISQAAQAARAQVDVQAAANGVEGNSVDLVKRAVTAEAADTASNLKYNTESELASLQVQKMINREAARMGNMYYYEPTEVNKADYTSGLFSNTLLDVSTSLIGIKPKDVSKDTAKSFGLGKTT